MAKKKETKKEEVKDEFNLEEELEAYPCPDWYKKAFLKTWDTSKIKNRNDMERALHDYGEMK
jgi:hypothetical protein